MNEDLYPSGDITSELINNNIKKKVIEEIKKIYDPEIPVNIYDLGLIYKVEVDEKNKINIGFITSVTALKNLF